MHGNREKFVARIKIVIEKCFLCSDGLNHHCRIQHSRDSPCGDQEIKQAKALLRKLLAAETLNNLLILSQKRSEQVSLVSLIFTFKFCSAVAKLHCTERATHFSLFKLIL